MEEEMKTLRRAAPAALLLLALTLLAACNFPGPASTPDLDATFAAQTLSAQLTSIAQPVATTAAPPTAIPLTPTTAPSPTTAPTSTVTATTVPCDRAGQILDITYPDGSDLAPGAGFVKTWRIRNTGSCTWTSGYSLVFDHGDSMGSPASIPLTAGTVAPGATVDVSVSLTAPAAAGTYRGYYRLRNPSGVLFGTDPGANTAFWVEIEVVPATTTVNITALAAESGMVWSDGTTYAARNVGDTDTNRSSQAFQSFDISGIPAGSTITSVTFNLTGFDTLGTPFADLGCLYIYQHDYGSIDAGDFVVGSPSGGLVRICDAGGLGTAVTDNDFVSALQSKVGSSRFQIRFQFPDVAVSADGGSDMVRFPTVTMTVRYYH
jgi:hypothetical protein